MGDQGRKDAAAEALKSGPKSGRNAGFRRWGRPILAKAKTRSRAVGLLRVGLFWQAAGGFRSGFDAEEPEFNLPPTFLFVIWVSI